MKETPPALDEQDRALVRQFLDGDREAANGLVDRYQKRLYNLALRMTGDVLDAEDITQTVFLNAFLKLSTYDPRFKFFSWIYRMTVNESLNVLKRRKPSVTLEGGPEMPVAESAPDRSAEAEDRVRKALLGLGPNDRAVVVLKHFLLFSYQEIADVLEIPVQTVKSRLYEARERLRLILHEKIEEPC
ncbi:MAG TPA: sigma-70 family RNA polymerase sigma factor [Gemmatimonadales bacterium]|nr:sigma-70 family RNA polymerase sigma factor [Gemmatimonadales bacterium]